MNPPKMGWFPGFQNGGWGIICPKCGCWYVVVLVSGWDVLPPLSGLEFQLSSCWGWWGWFPPLVFLVMLPKYLDMELRLVWCW